MATPPGDGNGWRGRMEAQVETLRDEVGRLRDRMHDWRNEETVRMARVYQEMLDRCKEIARDEARVQVDQARGKDFGVVRWVTATVIAVVALALSAYANFR